MLRLRGSEVLMLDGTIAMTEMISERDRRDHCLDMLLQKMCEHGDMVLGFDVEWPFRLSNGSLLILCSKFGCLLMKVNTGGFIDDNLKLRQFLTHKDIIFAGVHLQEDAKRLRETFKLEVRNVVDLSELAAVVLDQARLRAFGVRSLAHEVLWVPFKARPSSIISIDRSRDHVTRAD